jgi:hypothetical protein
MYGNIFSEHLKLLLLATYQTNQWTETQKFLIELKNKYLLEIKDQQINPLLFQIDQKLKEVIAKNQTIDAIEKAKPILHTGRSSLQEFEHQLRERRPDLSTKDAERIDYLLYFIHEYGNTNDFVRLYESYADTLFLHTHLKASKELLAIGDTKNAEKALLRYTSRWSPFEYPQVAPIQILLEQELFLNINPELGYTILTTPKYNGK